MCAVSKYVVGFSVLNCVILALPWSLLLCAGPLYSRFNLDLYCNFHRNKRPARELRGV